MDSKIHRYTYFIMSIEKHSTNKAVNSDYCIIIVIKRMQKHKCLRNEIT